MSPVRAGSFLWTSGAEEVMTWRQIVVAQKDCFNVLVHWDRKGSNPVTILPYFMRPNDIERHKTLTAHIRLIATLMIEAQIVGIAR
jgi:hypothetical protein